MDLVPSQWVIDVCIFLGDLFAMSVFLGFVFALVLFIIYDVRCQRAKALHRECLSQEEKEVIDDYLSSHKNISFWPFKRREK